MREKERFAGLLMVVPHGWLDITEDQPDRTATLARSDGVGALQFSSARHRSGARPNIGGPDLLRLLSGFARGELGAPTNVQEGRGANHYVAGDFRSDGWFTRAWYVSNGSDLAFVTYTVEEPLGDAATAELRDASTLIESLDFKQSFLSLVTERFGADGLYLLDEPEAALSPQRQLSLLAEFDRLARRDRSQLIIATHSPSCSRTPGRRSTR